MVPTPVQVYPPAAPARLLSACTDAISNKACVNLIPLWLRVAMWHSLQHVYCRERGIMADVCVTVVWSERHCMSLGLPNRVTSHDVIDTRVCVILYFLSLYMRPEGPWQRLRRYRSSGGGLFYLPLSLAPGPA